MSRKLITMDGNMAGAYVSYAYTEVTAIYPITPSSPMADYTSLWALKGRKNIFGEPVKIVQLQSEAGVAGAFHGMLNAGALSSTYTSSQGLLLMIPNMYKIAGELLPGVINVASRTVATHALSIFGDHQDVYACRQTGFAMLSTGSVQEVMDLTPIAHLSAIEGRIPFLNFFDGFRTSHEIQKIQAWDYEELKSFCNMEAVKAFKARSLNPERPQLRGSAQNPDVFFQIRESSNMYYNNLPDIVEKYMNMINKSIGTNYSLFNYYGAEDAENIIIAMGSVCDTIEETIDIIQNNKAIDVSENYNCYKNNINGDSNVKNSIKKVGLIRVHLYRPFSKKHFIKALPKTVKIINVLDRTKESGAVAEPLCEDVITALKGTEFENVKVLGGRYGLSSKNTTPADIMAVFSNENKNNFTVGIYDDVTHLSLKVEKNNCVDKNLKNNNGVEQIVTSQQGNIEWDGGDKDIISCKFWGMGADGTVGANKNTIKIIGDYTDFNVQAYFEYDSKKSGGLTISHLRFGKTRIKSAYLIEKADFVACHVQSYLSRYDLVTQVNKNGKLLINCEWSEDELVKRLKKSDIEYILNNNIKVYIIDGYKIAKDVGLVSRIGTIMQSAFFKVADIIPSNEAIEYMKQMVKKTYSSKGENIVNMNYDSIDRAVLEVREVDISSQYKEFEKNIIADKNLNKQDSFYNEKGIINGKAGFCDKCSFVENIQQPINVCKGDELPVSSFLNMADGTLVVGTSAFEKRGVADYVPVWNFEGCIQCNMCSYVCPHAVIRPVVMSESNIKNVPEGMKYTKMVGEKDKYFAITISSYDCTGCSLCANVCPGNMKNNVISMKKFNGNISNEKELSNQNDNEMLAYNKLDETVRQQVYFNYAIKSNENDKVWEHFKRNTIKGSQFFEPLLEFSGACAGCGETAYAKLVTQLFGERMIVANATGCSSIWAGSMPSVAYTDNKEKRGVAWSNSLFEDAAEYGYGMLLASESNRSSVFRKICELILHFKNENINNDNYLTENINEDSDSRQQEYVKCIRNQLIDLVEDYKKYYEDGRINSKLTDKIIAKIVEYKDIYNKQIEEGKADELKLIDSILENKEFLSKKSHWIFGGDGWAYDIGFSGLDHVLSTKADINILVFDTEVYSNTGGQASKATNLGAVAQFANNGKVVKKKNLADMMMTYDYVYVAQVSLGADMNQCVKALDEAEKYNGPSIVIAYAPCINHGIQGGMTRCIDEQKKAVQSGYWNIFRYNPDRKKNGEIPFQLDSKEPILEYTDFLMGENRYVDLQRKDKEKADRLFEQAKKDANERYQKYKKMAGK